MEMSTLPAIQDAHEFLNFLLNEIGDLLERDERERHKGAKLERPVRTWVHDIFHGKLVNETRCMMCGPPHPSHPPACHFSLWLWHQDARVTGAALTYALLLFLLLTLINRCETVTSREEDFLDLSLDIEQNSSLTSCFRAFRQAQRCPSSLTRGGARHHMPTAKSDKLPVPLLQFDRDAGAR